MATVKQIGVTYGATHIAKGVNELLKMLDGFMGKAGAPALERPSTWVTIGASVGLPILALLKLRDPWDKIAMIIGGYISTNLWDILSELMSAPAPAAYAPAVATAYTPAAVVSPSPVGATAAETPTF